MEERLQKLYNRQHDKEEVFEKRNNLSLQFKTKIKFFSIKFRQIQFRETFGYVLF